MPLTNITYPITQPMPDFYQTLKDAIDGINLLDSGTTGQVFKKTGSGFLAGTWQDDYSKGVQTNDVFKLKYKVFDATAVSIVDPNYDTGFTLTGVGISESNIVSFSVIAIIGGEVQNTQFICSESGLDLVFRTTKVNGWDTTGVTYPLGDVKVYIVEKA